MISRDTCAARDSTDPLAPLRALFAMERVDRQGVIYLDGNSLGVLPAATPARIAAVAEAEWGEGLIRSWNDTGVPRATSAESRGWITLSQRIGDKIARLIGAGPGEVMVGDSTSVNLFKVLNAAIAIAPIRRSSRGKDHAEGCEGGPHPLRTHQLPDRPLHRRHARARKGL